jgi:hypothetical protein
MHLALKTTNRGLLPPPHQHTNSLTSWNSCVVCFQLHIKATIFLQVNSYKVHEIIFPR